uniref:Integrase catalytic domain-containing protein n=1 Tax=Tanacetum cinerariifolium TaxID=118510 RepID=A0A6L2K9X1_TANCI|nr:hypothetical protein [Tanacetum cinerariifolium]
MADNRTTEETLQAPTKGYGDAIVVPDILAENFKIKTGLLSLIQANQFHGFESNNPHDHIRSFNRITSTLKFRDVSNDAIKLMLFPYSLEGAAKIKLSLPELTSTQMILELVDGSTTRPSDIAGDVFVKVRKFYIPTDFVVVDYVVDPHVPLILWRPFLRTRRALIDVYGEELTLRVDDEAITFKVGQTSKYSYNDAESINRIDVIDVACEEYVKRNRDFLTTPDELSNLDDDYYDTEGDILYLEKLINEDPSPNLSLVKTEDLKQVDATMTKPSIEEPPELELKELPSHLEYAFLEGNDKLPVIISKELKDEEKYALLKVLKSHKRAIAWKISEIKELKDEEKSALLKVLKSHKQAIAWKISEIKGIDPRFCTHKILMEDDFKPTVQHQRRVNPKIHKVIKKEVIKLLDAGLIYPISDSQWVSPVHCVPKKGGMTVVKNEDNELIPTRFRLTHKTKKRLHSLVLMEHLPTDICLLVYVMLLARSKGAVLGQQKAKHFQPIHYASKTMTDAQAHYTTKEKELLAVVYAFEKFRPYLVLSKTTVYTDHSALKAENLAADHLSRLENPHQDELEKKKIIETFPLETLLRELKPPFQWVLVDQRIIDESLCSSKAKALPTNDARVVVKILKSLFARFGTPHAIISDRGTHFYNDQFAKVVLKYGVTHHLSTAYHPQTSGQVEVSNCSLKRILERTIGENRASWSDKLDDALWAFRTPSRHPPGAPLISWCTERLVIYLSS